jgi:TrbL/VirB6 plasmid conjugal transfer protein/Transglycosylase SLT domain
MTLGRTSLALAVAGLFPAVASAQSTYTTAQLQALATQDAQQYGVPVQMFLDQIQAESSFNPNVGNSGAGAVGIAQFEPATAASLGIDPTNPAQALQGAAEYDAQLYQQQGSWTAALTAYSGGLTPAHPADYGPVFADASAATIGTATATNGTATATNGNGLSVSTSDGSTTGTATPAAGTTTAASGAAGALSLHPFTWAYNALIASVINQVNTSINQVETLASTPLTGVLVLMVIITGVHTMMGRISFAEYKSRILRTAFVVALVAPGSTYFTNWVEAPVLGLPAYFATQFTNAPMTTNGTAPSAASVLDAVFDAIATNATRIWSATPWVRMPYVALVLAVVLVISAVSLTVVFLVFGVLTLFTLIMLCMAPVFILALLFRELDRFFRGFVDVMVTLLISLLAVDIVLGFFETVMLQLENSVYPGGQNYTDAMSMVGQAIVLGIMGYSIKYLTRLIERIGGGVSIALDQVGYAMRGGFLQTAAVAPIRAGSRRLFGR